MQVTPIEKVRELTNQLNQWRYEYYNLNAPTVLDAVYDHHYDELERLENQTGIRMSNSPTQTVGYEVVDGLEKTTHAIPLLSLDKTKDMCSLMRFIGSHQVLLMHKLDGLTVKLEYENGSLVRASTRGNGDEGEIVTHNTRAIEGIPSWIPYLQRLVVVGEVYITKPTFEKLRETLRDSSGNPYKNARNMAAGSMRCHDAGACAGRGLVFSPFNVIEGFDGDIKEASSKYWNLFALNRLHNNIHNWFSAEQNQKLWKELQNMVTIENKGTATAPVNTENPFVGRTIVVTGTLVNFTRSSINAKIEVLGAKAGSAVSKNTDYLIYGDNAGSKLDKARALGIAILSEQKFLDMVESM